MPNIPPVDEAYRSTIRAMHSLLDVLSKLKEEGRLPESAELEKRIESCKLAVQVSFVYFPDLQERFLEPHLVAKISKT